MALMMTGTRLCQENEDRLKELGFDLPSFEHQNMSKFSENTSLPRELNPDLRRAGQSLSNATTLTQRHDAALELFALLWLACRCTHPEKAVCQSKSVQDADLSSPASMGTSGLVDIITDATLCILDAQDLNTERSIGEAGLASISLLETVMHTFEVARSSLLRVIAYTDPANPWVTDLAAVLANELLSSRLSGKELEDFMTDTVLQGFVRPALNSIGWPKTGSLATDSVNAETRASRQSPDGRRLQVIASIGWSLRASGVGNSSTIFPFTDKDLKDSLVAREWPLFVPALVTLAEDQAAMIRVKAMKLLSTFLYKCPHRTLHATGLDSVFESALFPSLLFLPSLTPEEESAQLLRATYYVLLELARTYQDSDISRRRRLLDAIIRDGIMTNHRLAGGYSRINEVLMEIIPHAVNELGLHCSKHLPDLLSVIEPILVDPFIGLHLSTMIHAGDALDAVMLNCWPRILQSTRAQQILGIIGTGWLTLHDSTSRGAPHQQSLETIEVALQSLERPAGKAKLLWERQDQDAKDKIGQIVSREPRLARMLHQIS